MVEVVVLGGGFAGVAAVKALLKKTKRSEVHITLVDKNSYHLFTPSLYEVASSEEPQKNVCIPLSEILPGISMIKDEVLTIKKDEKKVQFKNQTIEYDYLIITLGSEPEYHDIPGLEEYSIPFKSLKDAVKIRKVISDKRKEKDPSTSSGQGKIVQILVGGGGASGCEFAAELSYHLKNVKIALIQKSPQLVRELDIEAAAIAYKRLVENDVEIIFGERIAMVEKGFVETDTRDKHEFDILVWAGGIRGSSIIKKSNFETDEKGRLKVNDNLEVLGEENIFAAGDIAHVQVKEKISATIRVAKEEGEIAGLNIVHKLKKESLENYKFKNQIFIVPLVGKYAVVQFNNFLIKGFIGWLIQQFVFLRYLLNILPVNKAFKRWNRFEEYLMR